MESERDDMGPSAELRQLMTRLSLANSKALAAVIEVDEELAEGWLAGTAPVPGDVIVMLRGLAVIRSEEHTSELQSLMRISYAVFCLKKKKKTQHKAERLCKSIPDRIT